MRVAREIEWISTIIRKYDSLNHARLVAQQFAEAAAREFEAAYADAPEGDDKRFVRDLIQYAIGRQL
jgi:geranylgeranyl pyrophosphate synthase